MENLFDRQVAEFIRACQHEQVLMLMIGGGAVNFHGYRRHSADVDFWIDVDSANLARLKRALMSIGFESFEFPDEVLKQEQNITIDISPGLDLELNTRISLSKSFADALHAADDAHYEAEDGTVVNYKVISFDDLIESKERAGRPQDKLDILQLLHNRNLQ